jgi:rubredoxin
VKLRARLYRCQVCGLVFEIRADSKVDPETVHPTCPGFMITPGCDVRGIVNLVGFVEERE